AIQPMGCGVCLPLWADRELIGVLHVQRPRPRALSWGNVRFLQDVARWLGPALWKTGIVEELQMEVAFLRARGVYQSALLAGCTDRSAQEDALLESLLAALAWGLSGQQG